MSFHCLKNNHSYGHDTMEEYSSVGFVSLQGDIRFESSRYDEPVRQQRSQKLTIKAVSSDFLQPKLREHKSSLVYHNIGLVCR